MAIFGTLLSNPVYQRGLEAAQALAGVPAAAPAPTQAETQRQQAEMERQRAFQAALRSPDMPIPPEFSTGSALVDEQERLRARYALMRDAGRSAVVERARAQGRSVTYDQAGNPVIGDMPQTPIVQAGPEGTRIAYRNGIPVGFSTPTATPSAEEMRFNQPYRSDAAAREAQIQKETAALPAEQRASIAARLGVENTPAAIARSLSAGVSATRSSMAGSPEQGEEIRRQATALAAQQRATEIMRSGAQKFNADNAARGVQMTPTGGYLMTPMAAPAAAAPVAAPAIAAQVMPTPSAFPIPNVPTQPTPMAAAPFRDASGRVDTAAVARAQGRTPVETAAPPVTPDDVDAALEEAQLMQETQAISQAERLATQATQTFENQIAELTRRLTAATRAGNRAETTRLINAIRRLRSERAGQLSSAPIIEPGSPMF